MLGCDRFCNDIKEMIGFAPGIYWRVCWRFLAPAFLMVRNFIKYQNFMYFNFLLLHVQFIIVYGLIGYEPLTYEDYVYPPWANALGWTIAGSSVAMIPGMAIYKLIVTPGSIKQV